MWERLIRIRPSLIVLIYSGRYDDNKLFQIALDNGYKIKERDLKRNKEFRKSEFVMEKAVEINPSFIKYYESNYFMDWNKLTSKALENGYQPTIQDLKNNPFMGYSREIVEMIITEETVNQINIDDIKERSELAQNDMVFRHLITINPNNITHYEGHNQELFRLAISANNGYQPSISDLDDNPSLGNSDDIMERLIKQTQDGNLIFKYRGNNEKIFELAINLGIDEERMINSIKDDSHYEHYNLKGSKAIMKKAIEKNSSLIEYYNGNDIEVFEYAFEKGYIPTEAFFESHKYDNIIIIRLMIIAKPELISILYNENPSYNNSELLTLAVKNGYIPTEEEMNRNQLNNNELVSLLIDKKPEYIKYYTGTDIELLKKAIQQGYVPSTDTIKKIINDSKYEDLIISIVKLRPDYIENFEESYKLYIRILAFDYIPSMEEVKNNYRVKNNLKIMKKLIMYDPNYIICCGDSLKDKVELYEIAIDNGYNIDDLLVDEAATRIIFKSDKIMKLLIQTKDINYIKKYEGTNIEIFKLVVGKCSLKPVTFNNNLHSIEDENNAIIQFLTNNNFEMITEHEELISAKYNRLFKIAIELGYIPHINNIYDNNISYFNENILQQIIDNSTKNDCIEFFFRVYNLNEDIKEYILKSKNIDISLDYITLLKNYKYDKVLFINNYSKYNNFLKELGIDETKFTQFEFLSSYDWLKDILNIVDNEKTAEFKKVEEYFFENYYLKENNNINEATKIKSFVNILKNYNKYPEICLEIVNQNVDLNDELIEKIEFLFAANEVLDEKDRPKSINDINSLHNVFSSKFLSEIQNIDKKSIEEIKEIICKQLFNENLGEVIALLSTYGDTEDLRQLLFDNRENNELQEIINEMMIYTSMMESIIEATDKQYLIDMIKRIADNFELATRCMMIFTRFDEKMQELYSEELSTNLTVLRDDITLDSLVDRKMTEDCGVEVLDFSDRQYCLLAHVKSSSETEEEVILGKSSNSHNFISLSAISHRNQVFYAYSESSDIVFGYDSLPDGSFMQSSVSNIGTNGLITNNSLEVSQGYRQQRGTLKTSMAPNGNNSEVLCIREGIRPRYIILPGGRKPREEEISLAQRYGLKFVKTQEVRKEIDNPKKIEPGYKKPKDSDLKPKNIQGIREIKSALTPTNHDPRKIAIFTDSHALFEPTLAILEDARKSGITEIYSLGDNIGTGPNPREVLELLDEYGVESLSGNHEIYAALGIEDPRVKEHLEHKNATEEARRNSTWTRAQLTQEQLERIRNNPEQIVIEIGGQKVLLTHYAYDYNTDHKLQIPNGVTHTFQGHDHFEGESDDITTLRGAGIGAKGEDNGQAYYIVLVEKPDGGYDIEKHIISYDSASLRSDIKSSDMPLEDKNKIEGWAGVRK